MSSITNPTYLGGNRLNPFNYEFGVSENIARGIPGGAFKQSGGSNIIPDSVQNIFRRQSSSANTGGNVLGATDVVRTDNTNTQQPVIDISNANVLAPTSQQPSAGGQRNGVINDSQSLIDLYRQQVENNRITDSEIDSAFAPQFANLDATQALTQNNYNQAVDVLDKQFGINRQTLQDQTQTANAQLAQQGDQAQQRALSAEAAARRLYNELSQANQQRFGGSSSAGVAASELQGREFQKNRGNIRQALEDTIRTIDQQKLEVQNQYNNAIQQLRLDYEQSRNSVRQRFDETMLQIASSRDMLEEQKREARQGALKEYRDQILQLNIQAADFSNTLQNQAQAATQTIDSALGQYLQSIGVSADQLSAQADRSPLVASTAYGVTDPGMTNTDPALTGAIDEEDQMMIGQREPLNLDEITGLPGLSFAN